MGGYPLIIHFNRIFHYKATTWNSHMTMDTSISWWLILKPFQCPPGLWGPESRTSAGQGSGGGHFLKRRSGEPRRGTVGLHQRWMVIQWRFNGDFMGISWGFHGIDCHFMVISWWFNDDLIGFWVISQEMVEHDDTPIKSRGMQYPTFRPKWLIAEMYKHHQTSSEPKKWLFQLCAINLSLLYID